MSNVLIVLLLINPDGCMEKASHRAHSTADSLESDCWYHSLRMRYTCSWWKGKVVVVVDDQCANIPKRKEVVSAAAGASSSVF